MNRIFSKERSKRGALVLVNAQHPLQCAAAERLQVIRRAGPRLLLQPAAAAALRLLLERVGAGERILPVSAYRTQREQEALYQTSLRENGPEYTQKFVALPGCSEHQTGLALDMALLSGPVDPICPAFPNHGVCAAFRRAAADFGFVERYPKGKEHITGIAYEPWYFRYVGRPHAWIMQERGLVLEEYLALLHTYPAGAPLRFARGAYAAEIFCFPAGEGGEKLLPVGAQCEMSGDNMGGLVATVWKEGGR